MTSNCHQRNGIPWKNKKARQLNSLTDDAPWDLPETDRLLAKWVEAHIDGRQPAQCAFGIHLRKVAPL